VQVGDLVRIKGEQEVMLVTEDWSGASDQVTVLRSGRLQYIKKAALEVISESR
tara:strand:- start:1341 stop:1499 length:159 start_codon:yes stop_codon:yes gene_type:complete